MPPSPSLTQHTTTTTKVYTTFSFPLPIHAAYSDNIALIFIQEDEKIAGKVPLAQFSGGHRMALFSSPSGGGGEGGGGKRGVSLFSPRAQVLTSVEEYAIDLTGDEPVEICTSTKVKVPCKPVKCSAEIFQYCKDPNGDGNNNSSSINVEGLVAFGLLQSNTAVHAAIVPLNKLESRRPLRGESSMETLVLKVRNNNNNNSDNNNDNGKVGNGSRGVSVPTSFSQGAFTLSFVDEAQQQSAEPYSASPSDTLISYKIALDPPKNSNHKEKHRTKPIAIKIEAEAEAAAGPSSAGPCFLHHHQQQQHQDDQQARERDGPSPPPPPPPSSTATNTNTNTKPPPPKYQFHYCEYGGKFRVVDWKPEWTCPYDCCGMQCRDFTSLKHHLLAMHPYQEYWFDYYDAGHHRRQRQRQAHTNRGPPGSQQKQQQSQQQQLELQSQGELQNQKQKQEENKGQTRIYSRCRLAWFKKDGGDFYPLRIPANDDRDGTLLYPLLSHTEREMPFIYHCPKKQRKLRFTQNAKYPVDTWEWGLESLAEKQRQEEDDAEAEAEEEVVEVGGVGGGGGRGLKGKSKNDLDIGKRNRGQGAVIGASGGGKNNSREKSKKRKLQQQQLAANDSKQTQSPSKKSRDGPNSRPAGRRGIALLNRDGRPKFYHSQTCVMMMADEILNSREDSDQEEDVEEWKRDCIERLREVVGLCPEERRFMYEWNMFVRERPVHADADMAETCVAFAQVYKGQLAVTSGRGNSVTSGNDAFRRCFIGHLLNLWSFRLISYDHMNKILKVASGGGGGGGEEEEADRDM